MGVLVEQGLCSRKHNEWGAAVDAAHETLLSYDEFAYFQRREQGMAPRPQEKGAYRGSLLFREMQVCLNGVPVRVLLSMAAGYIYSKLCDNSSGLIQRFIPFRYIPGRDHGRSEGPYRIWNMRIHANGREGIVEQVRRRVWVYERERLDSLLTDWDMVARSCVYFMKEPGALHLVFSDKEALRRVRFRSFAADCRKLMRSSAELGRAIGEEMNLIGRYIEAQLCDIVAHQPNVTPISGRYRTIAR